MKTKHPPLIVADRIEIKKKIESKKCIFDAITSLLEKGQSEVSKNEIFDALIQREKMGDTYLGKGISVPRAFINITYPRASLLILKKGIRLNTADKKDINFILAVLLPIKQKNIYSNMLLEFHAKLLKQTSMKKFTDPDNIETLANNINNLFLKQ